MILKQAHSFMPRTAVTLWEDMVSFIVEEKSSTELFPQSMGTNSISVEEIASGDHV